MMKWGWLVVWVACLGGIQQVHAQVDIGDFIKKDAFGDIKISPDGEYYAATVPLEDRTGLVILQRSGLKVTARFALGKNTHIDNFTWVSPTRVVLSMSQKFGALDTPRPTGELYGINADGSNREILVGQRAQGSRIGSNIQPAKSQDVAATLVDDLAHDDKYVIVAVWPFLSDPITRAEKMDVSNGRRVPVTRAPVRNADFTTDNAGVVRFAQGSASDNNNQLYYRAGDDTEWKLVNDESGHGYREFALGFSTDDSTAYLRSERPKGPDAIISFDVATGKRTEIQRDPVVDPYLIIRGLGNKVPVGAMYMRGKPHTVFFDEASREARLYRSLESAFPDEAVYVTSSTSDGKLALVQVWSDRNPGDFFLFDTVSKKASILVSRREWFDPEQMAATKSYEVKARDGLALNAYLTLPPGSNGKGLPMVVMPHGGPFGIFDTWGFDNEVQILAKSGYAVLQPNFRGSGGYGRSFQSAGAREWGGAMQNDVTDATRWAIASGIADPARICIYGASYGAFAALSGVAKEPAIYRCAAGYVGVYDLPMMHQLGDIQQRTSGETYLREWIGARDQLAGVSPTNMADRIKAPVFLAAGGEDERAPIEHSRLMERRLKSAGVPVETLYFDTEGHGFYTEPHRREYYVKLLAFLARNLSGEKTQ